MADAGRKAEPKHKEPQSISLEAQQRHERLTLVLFLEGAVAIVAGMVVLSQFLSNGKADRDVLYVAGGLGGVFVLGFAVTYFLRRRADRAAAAG